MLVACPRNQHYLHDAPSSVDLSAPRRPRGASDAPVHRAPAGGEPGHHRAGVSGRIGGDHTVVACITRRWPRDAVDPQRVRRSDLRIRHSQARSRSVATSIVAGQHPAGMPLIERNHEIQTLAPYRADHAFACGADIAMTPASKTCVLTPVSSHGDYRSLTAIVFSVVTLRKPSFATTRTLTVCAFSNSRRSMVTCGSVSPNPAVCQVAPSSALTCTV